MNIAIIDDVIEIIKMPLALKTITVSDQDEDKKGNESKYVFPAAGKTPPDIQIESIVFVYHFHSHRRYEYAIRFTTCCKLNLLLQECLFFRKIFELVAQFYSDWISR
jgi:hypothetical protein